MCAALPSATSSPKTWCAIRWCRKSLRHRSIMNSKKMPELSLAVQYASTAQNLPTRAQLRRWVKAAVQRDVRITLRIVDKAEGRELNKNYRGKDYATNVLTFVYDDEQTPPGLPLSGEEILTGDVVICAPVVEQEAAAQHKELLAHYAHLAIHAAQIGRAHV